MKKTIYILVCHSTDEWSTAKAFPTFEKAKERMTAEYNAEFDDALASGYDEDEMKSTSHIGEHSAVVGWGCLPSPYIFAIHEDEVEL